MQEHAIDTGACVLEEVELSSGAEMDDECVYVSVDDSDLFQDDNFYPTIPKPSDKSAIATQEQRLKAKKKERLSTLQHPRGTIASSQRTGQIARPKKQGTNSTVGRSIEMNATNSGKDQDTIKIGDITLKTGSRQLVDQPVVTETNEVIDDYVRNFLMRTGMFETLDAFEQEWYSTDHPESFRDILDEIEYLKLQIANEESEARKWQDTCQKIHATTDTIKQEVKFYRNGGNLLDGEKQQLNEGKRKLVKAINDTSQSNSELEQRWMEVNKQRSLLRLEKEKLIEEIKKLEGQQARDKEPPRSK